MKKTRGHKRSLIIMFLLSLSLVFLPIISQAELSMISDTSDDASIILAMDYEEEAHDDSDADVDMSDAEGDDSDSVDEIAPDSDLDDMETELEVEDD